ncbi:FmdB family zinc ribbon protein [Spirillospora sp. NPDC047279]|uniref:FmdB family zinc ribbon protein n=1 Tax=Spirillospora sp. NPDC047279 TaxID=3155478 RepID=UPI0033CF953E
MPTYQYVCTECGEPLEVVQKFSDDALTECPTCTGKLRKVFSAAGIIFKGSGFYRTDSRGSSKSSSTVGAGNGAASSNGGSGDKSDSTTSSSSSSPSSSSSSDSSGGGSGSSSSSGGGSSTKVA